MLPLSSLNVPRLVENRSNPSCVNNLLSILTQRTWSRWTSKSCSIFLLLEKLGGSKTIKSNFSPSFTALLIYLQASSVTQGNSGPTNPFALRLSSHHVEYVVDISTETTLFAPPLAAYTEKAPVYANRFSTESPALRSRIMALVRA